MPFFTLLRQEHGRQYELLVGARVVFVVLSTGYIHSDEYFQNGKVYDLQWVALDAHNDGLGVETFLGAPIELFDHDNRLARLAAGRHDGDLNIKRLVQIPLPSLTKVNWYDHTFLGLYTTSITVSAHSFSSPSRRVTFSATRLLP